ncbi:hypothetical protein V6N13_024996 [Hibiscus sabdariffa]
MTLENGGIGSNTNANSIDENEAIVGCENEVVVGDLGVVEACQNEVVLGENKDDTGEFSSGQDTAYLDSSDVESYETYSDGDVVVKMAGKGLLEEIHICLPLTEHRFCAQHMYVNSKKDHKGDDLQKPSCFYVKATIEFEIRASIIAKLKGEANDPRYWLKAFFISKSRCDAIDNFSEAFNYAILGVRYKSLSQCLKILDIMLCI